MQKKNGGSVAYAAYPTVALLKSQFDAGGVRFFAQTRRYVSYIGTIDTYVRRFASETHHKPRSRV
jgi:hypothetical protein